MKHNAKQDPPLAPWAGMNAAQKERLLKNWANYVNILLTDADFHDFLASQYSFDTSQPGWQQTAGFYNFNRNKDAAAAIRESAGKVWNSIQQLQPMVTTCTVKLSVDF